MEISLAQKALNQVKMRLITDVKCAFVSSVFFQLDFKWSDEISTACIGGKLIEVNPDFFLAQDFEVRLFIILHETWHFVFKHQSLRNSIPECDPLVFNYAADYAINNRMINDGFRVWANALVEPKFDDWSTTRIYNHLMENPPEDGFDSKYLDITDAPPTNDSTLDQEQEINNIILRAYHEASTRNPGSIPGDVKVIIDEFLKPKIPFEHHLRKYFTQMAQQYYTFRKPNRRYMPDMILPTLTGESLGSIGVAFDASLSVSEEELKFFTSEMEGIRQLLNPEVTHLVTFDTQVQTYMKIPAERRLKTLELAGRGGTDFDDMLEFFHKKDVDVLVVFSDMDAPPIEFNYTKPILWVCVNNFHAPPVPFGDVIHYEHI